jgi:hypothetical protein
MPDNEMMGDEQLPQDDHRNPRRRERQSQTPEVGLLVMPEPRHELDKLVLHEEARGDIATALRSLAMAEQMEEVWKLSTIRVKSVCESYARNALWAPFSPPTTSMSEMGHPWRESAQDGDR